MDVIFPAARLGVELDGGVHQTIRNFHDDRRKGRRLEALHDLLVFRVTAEDLAERGDELAADLRTVLGRRTPNGG